MQFTSQSAYISEIQNLYIASLLYQYNLNNPQVFNLYLYCLNNSINSIDPFGLWLQEAFSNTFTVISAALQRTFVEAGIIPLAASPPLTLVTAPLSDFIFPSPLNAGEREWLLERDLREFREAMEKAKRGLEELEREYPGLFDDIDGDACSDG